ncbi:MAG: GNAT family N-acetyltransferase [Actinobacteria bacterium]|uniref:Unannotated protein n=1 Tax=freshwater metagenome TaxID=449393 RepID=A0A6J7ITF9_9ZZZZ|nr:GNAT family N-acetyltransferase [Actinomycetota bacterium]MSW92731.1 GNAT family N-acetyltransferase [Actinomycetota bacterium]MSX88666.1 GNAT family N-acetyltransferase [Actinomycetota bacterium]MSY70709.1 GNAT family N-acetyltransferase [Actinomycetota bacterium]
MTTTVRDNVDLHRYEIIIDDNVVGIADYSVQGDTIVLPHTVIDPAHRGQGLAAQLVRGALDDIRARGLTVDARCWYVAEFIESHVEYADLTNR